MILTKSKIYEKRLFETKKHDHLITHSPLAGHSDFCMARAAETDYKKLLKFFIYKGAKDWNLGLYHASHEGRKEMIDFFISKGANDWDTTIYSSSLSGHENISQYFFSFEKVEISDWLISDTAKEGHKRLSNFFYFQKHKNTFEKLYGEDLCRKLILEEFRKNTS